MWVCVHSVQCGFVCQRYHQAKPNKMHGHTSSLRNSDLFNRMKYLPVGMLRSDTLQALSHSVQKHGALGKNSFASSLPGSRLEWLVMGTLMHAVTHSMPLQAGSTQDTKLPGGAPFKHP